MNDGHAGTDMQDSEGRELRRFLAKPAHDDPDELESVAGSDDFDGNTPRRVRKGEGFVGGADIVEEGESITRLGDRTLEHIADTDDRKAVTADQQTGAERAFAAITEDLKLADGIEAEGDVFIPTTALLKIGTSATPASLTKTIRLPFSLPRPITDGGTFNLASGYLDPRVASTTVTYQAGIVLPKGATITLLRGRMYRASSASSSIVALWRGSDTSGLGTKIAEVTTTTDDWSTPEASGSPLPQLVGDETYILVVQLFSASAFADSRFLWAEIDYTVPDYAVGV